MRSRSQRTLVNIVIFAVYELVAFICGLILPRFILRYFGSTYNGIISSISQFLSYISVLTVGISGASRVVLYKAIANKDQHKINAIINANERYMRKVGLILIAYIAVLAVVYPLVVHTDSGVIERWQIALLVGIIGTGSFAQYFFGITYQTLLTADQKKYLYYLIQIGAVTLNTIIAVVLIVNEANIFIVKLGSSCVFALSPLVLRIIVRRHYRLDKAVPPDIAGLKGRWDVMWHSLANMVHDHTDIIVLTLFNNVKLVSVYSVHYLVIKGLNRVFNVFTSSLEAPFGDMFANGEYETGKRRFDVYEFVVGLFVSVVFACALVLIVPFIAVYTRDIHDESYIVPTFAVLAILAQMFMSLRNPYVAIVQAAGHYKQTKNGAVIEALINLMLSVALTFRFGLVGVTVGTLAANVFRTLQYALYLRKNILCRPFSLFIKSTLWIFGNIAVATAACSWILSFMKMDSWLIWIMGGVICVVISTCITIISSILLYRRMLKETKFVLHSMLHSATKKRRV